MMKDGRVLSGEAAPSGSAAAHGAHEQFIPALGVDWLTPFYDFVARLFGDRAIKRRLIEQARIAPGDAVLDLGCGTGTLACLVKEAHPGARVTGVDIDPKILAIARRKIEAAGLDVELVRASATEIPLPDASFDRVLSTLVLHHLTTDQKRSALAGARRLLRAGGELHVADFGPPQNALMSLVSFGFGLHHRGETIRGNLSGELPALIAEVGFRDVREVERRMTLFGSLSYLRAVAA